MTAGYEILCYNGKAPHPRDLDHSAVPANTAHRLGTFVTCLAAIMWMGAILSHIHEVAEPDRAWIIGLSAISLYGLFVGAGILSVYDVPGWVSNMSLPPPGRRKPRTVVLSASKPFHPTETKRVGVVFAGGGGKGAYQIGCYKALLRRGIVVDYMSGSSVGALNIPMLLGHGDTHTAEALWRSLSASQLMSTELVALPATALFAWRWFRSQNFPAARLAWLYAGGIIFAGFVIAGLVCTIVQIFELAMRSRLGWALWPIGIFLAGGRYLTSPTESWFSFRSFRRARRFTSLAGYFAGAGLKT